MKILFLIAGLFCVYWTQAQDLGTIGSQKPFSLKGSAQVRGIFYDASGIPDRRTPFSYLLAGNLIASIYGISIPVSFSFSEEERSVSQPFNQFGISPHYKWVTLHLGYQNVSFNPYTLAGYTMLGAGVELTPGKLRFGFMYGRLNRATTIDTTTQSLAPVSFTRTAYAVKLGYGTENNFVDVSVLKGRDDASSLSVNKNTLDSLDVLPAANTVFGISAKFSLTKHLFVEGNAGTSLYTQDINSPLVLDSLNIPVLKSLKSIATVNGTSSLYTAMDAAIGYKEKLYSVKLQYQRIDPDFQSMGAYFFNSDLESYSVAPSFRLFKNKFRFNGSIGFQHDNLQHQKEATTHKIIATAMLSADFTKQLGIDVNYSNFSNNQQPNTLRFADSLKIVQTTQNFSVSPRWMLAGARFTHAIILSANVMQMNDFNTYFAQNAISRNINYTQYYLNYSIGYLPSGLSVFVNLSTTDADAPGTSDKNTGGTLGFSKTFLKSALLISASGGYFEGPQSGVNATTVNASANVGYKFLKRHSLSALFFYTNVTAPTPGFTETRVELAYAYSF